MALVLTAAPAAESISLAEAKAHLRIDADDEDALIASLIVAARTFSERTLRLALITQGWSYFLDFWPRSSCVTLPISPVQAVGTVTLHGAAGGSTTLDAGDYAVDVLSAPARLVLNGASPPVVARELNAFEIAFTAGYGDDASDVPAPIRHALTLLVAHASALDQEIGVGDGATSAFQLTKTYGAAFTPWTRAITQPVAGSVLVAVDGVLQAPERFAVNATTGVISFVAEHIPGEGAAVTAGFAFDVPVRFDTDQLEINLGQIEAG